MNPTRNDAPLNRRYIVGLDVGTAKVAVVVGAVDAGGVLEVVASSTVPSKGLERGAVVNIEATRACIAEAMNHAQQQLGLPIKSAHVGISGAHV